MQCAAAVVQRIDAQQAVPAAAGHTGTAVVEAAGIDRQVVLGMDQAAPVVEFAAGQGEIASSQNATRRAGIAVEQGRAVGVHGKIAGCLQQAAGIIQGAGSQSHPRRGGGQGAAPVVQRLLPGVQRQAGTQQGALRVAQSRGLHHQRTRGLQRATSVVHTAGTGQFETGVQRGNSAGLAIVQRGGRDPHGIATDQHARPVVDAFGGGDGQLASGAERAGAVSQRPGLHVGCPARSDHAALAIVQQPIHRQRQRRFGLHHAGSVEQLGGVQRGVPARCQQPICVVEATRHMDLAGLFTSGLQSAGAVVQLPRSQVERAVGGKGAICVVQPVTNLQLQGLDAGGDQPTAGSDQVARLHPDTLGAAIPLAQVDVLTRDLQGAVAHQAAAGAIQTAYVDRQQSFAGVLDGTAFVDQSLRRQRHVAVAGQQAGGVVQQVADTQLQGVEATSDQPSTSIDQVTGIHLDTLGAGAAPAQVNVLTA